MEKQIKELAEQNAKTGIPQIKAGDTVKVYQKYKDKDNKDKIQMFEGMVLCRKHGNEIGAAITVRKIVSGVGVEKIFPLHSPIIEKIEIAKSGKTRRSKLYYLRTAKGRKARLKQIVTKPAKAKAMPAAEQEVAK